MKKTAVLSVFVLALGLGVSVFLTQQKQDLNSKASNDPVSLSIVLDKTEVKVGDKIVANIAIDSKDKKTSAIIVEVIFPENILKLDSSDLTDFLPTVLTKPTTTAGKFLVTLGSTPTDPKSGPGIIANLNFTAKSAGSAKIEFGSESAVAVIGLDTNALEKTLSGTVNVSESSSNSTPTPTPSATPPGASPTPTPTPFRAKQTPKPQKIIKSCGQTCAGHGDCQAGLFCYNDVCRDPLCADSPDCACSLPTPTPTPTIQPIKYIPVEVPLSIWDRLIQFAKKLLGVVR